SLSLNISFTVISGNRLAYAVHSCDHFDTMAEDLSERNLRKVTVETRNSQGKVVSHEYHLPDGYKLTDLHSIGSGTYGTVIRTYATVNRRVKNNKRTRKEVEVAVKKFRIPVSNKQRAQRCYREIKLLQLLKHPNIARIFDLYSPDKNANDLNEIYLVTEYVGSSIEKFVNEQNERYARNEHVYLTIDMLPRVIRDILNALLYLKSVNVLHRDLKPSNLAINGDKAVLIDYGMARIKDSSELTDKVQTLKYSAPEVHYWKSGSYEREVDMWSIGCILAELITWQLLFDFAIPSHEWCEHYISLFGPIPDSFLDKVIDRLAKEMMAKQNSKVKVMDLETYFMKNSKVVKFEVNDEKLRNEPIFLSAIDFLAECIKFDPVTRITIENALNHPFIRNCNSSTYPLSYDDDANRSIDEWKKVIFNEINSFEAREDTPVP
ncbi:hypothetical protein PENTCL1PPCAC_8691, partial [Pristionchus entomophagus]